MKRMKDHKRPYKNKTDGNYMWLGLMIKRSTEKPTQWAVWYNPYDIFQDGYKTLSDAMIGCKQALANRERKRKIAKREHLKLLNGGVSQ